MMKSSENAKKPVFPAHFSIFDRKNCFSKNLAPSHFGDCHFASLCQKKLMSQSREKLVTDARTNERTDNG